MQSGLVFSDNFTPIIITQGLTGYTLVTRKKILFRIYLTLLDISQVTSVAASVSYRLPDSNFELKKHFLIPAGDLFIENSPPNGPSIGILFEGKVFESHVLIHAVEFRVMFGSRIISRDKTPDMQFSQSGTLRILAKAIQSITRTAPWGNKITSDIFWLVDLNESLIRFGAMLPVSDGVSFGSNPAPHIGLAYLVGGNIDAWPDVCPSGASPSIPDKEYPDFLVCPASEMMASILAEAKQLNSLGIRIDITVGWRPRDPMKPPTGEPAGGSAPNGTNPISENRFAHVVGGLQNGFQTTASIMAQEVAHNFGCVSGASPHSDGGWHSKDPDILDPFAFDFVLLRPYLGVPRGPLADVMGQHLGRGKDLVLFSAYDWEHLRKKLVELSGVSTEIVDETETEKFQKKVADDLQIAFADLQQMDVENPESSLSSKPGFEWHWTRLGFQLLREGAQKRNRYGLTPDVEMIFSALKELGISEFYAPIGGKPMTIVINPDSNNYVKCEIGDSFSG